jgi:hypothetical protein
LPTTEIGDLPYMAVSCSGVSGHASGGPPLGRHSAMHLVGVGIRERVRAEGIGLRARVEGFGLGLGLGSGLELGRGLELGKGLGLRA